jgi:hypothetical protein
LVNFVVSAALTLATGKIKGVKVPGKLLNKVYHLSGLSSMRLPYHVEPGESVESLLGFAWLKNCISCEVAAEIVYSAVKNGKSIEEALSILVNEILRRCA